MARNNTRRMDMEFTKPIPCRIYEGVEAIILASVPPASDKLFMCSYTTIDGCPRKLIVHEDNISRGQFGRKDKK